MKLIVKKVIRKGKPRDILRQKNLARLLVENGGKTPIGKLMIKAGYKPGYAHNPQKVKRTLSWQELMDKYAPDDYITKKLRDLLDKRDENGIDAFAVSKGLDMILKLKNKYPKGQGDNEVTVHIKKDD